MQQFGKIMLYSHFTCGVGVLTAGSSEPTKYNIWISLPLQNEPPASQKFTAKKKKKVFCGTLHPHHSGIFQSH